MVAQERRAPCTSRGKKKRGKGGETNVKADILSDEAQPVVGAENFNLCKLSHYFKSPNQSVLQYASEGFQITN
jgi:hypothetical protein